MNIAVSKLAQSILKKPLRQCSIDELARLAYQYPYFGPVQFLLAKKLQEENSSELEEQVQKTSLYFQNRLWLQYLLNDKNEQQENFSPGQQPLNEGEKTAVQNIAVPETGPVPDDAVKEQRDQGEQVKSIELPKTESVSVDQNTELKFEPYHTVDYFASQGIKFKEEDRPKDRFSQQLKSFTEWLKTMKRIPVSELTTGNNSPGEKKVEQLAEHSLTDRDVVTEAMAEVWEKQGNKLKAEEVYLKLSLLDPPKSAYFAAKIEDLKKPR